MTDEQKTYYIDNVCNICANKNNCNKAKFILVNVYDKLSIRCLEYKYENK